MILRILTALLLTLPLLLATACDRTEAPLSPAGGGSPTGPENQEAPANPQKTLQMDPSYLEWLYGEPDTYTYEVAFSGSIDIAAGGMLWGFPSTWGPDYTFAMSIPAGAIVPPAEGIDSVTITCYVPVLDTTFPTTDDPMPLIFEPDGLQFSQPATVWLCYHPNLTPTCDGYTFASADYDPVLQTYYSAESYLISNAPAQAMDKTAAPPRPLDPLPLPPDPCAVWIQATMNHFSRWAVGKGNGGDGP
jgi:hypothetical protein